MFKNIEPHDTCLNENKQVSKTYAKLFCREKCSIYNTSNFVNENVRFYADIR